MSRPNPHSFKTLCPDSLHKFSNREGRSSLSLHRKPIRKGRLYIAAGANRQIHCAENMGLEPNIQQENIEGRRHAMRTLRPRDRTEHRDIIVEALSRLARRFCNPEAGNPLHWSRMGDQKPDPARLFGRDRFERINPRCAGLAATRSGCSSCHLRRRRGWRRSERRSSDRRV